MKKYFRWEFLASFVMGLVFILVGPLAYFQISKEGSMNVGIIIFLLVIAIIGIVIMRWGFIKVKSEKYINKRLTPKEKKELYLNEKNKIDKISEANNNAGKALLCISFGFGALFFLYIALETNIWAIIGTIICSFVSIYFIINWRNIQ